ncbi:MAG: hypothetical protein EXS36_03450 [Pedosphaera sp.]|nr:hypothetical protein [Pedosphaera sp.]
MNTRIALASLMSLCLFGSLSRAEQEVGFLEKFALAPNREAVLGQLVPGTEEYYFFHALHYQNTAQNPKLAGILEQWGKRFPDSAQRRILVNREALLGYDTDPQKTLQFLRNRLGLQFNHVQKVVDRKPDLPVTLDPARISRDVSLRASLADDNLSGLADDDLDRLVRDSVSVRPAQRRTVLSKLNRPDVPGLVEWIAEDLKTQESRGFGEFGIHRALLPAQLEQLQGRVPALAQQPPFIFARLRKLVPGADADGGYDPVEREAWLGRVWDGVRTLPPAFNSLKAHVLYTRLQHDRTRGVYDRARFLKYLSLPRPMPYMNPRYLQSGEASRFPADLSQDFNELRLGAGAIGSDETLVREFVLKLVAEDAGWEPWAEWLLESWVKPVFAEAKITAGVGDPEQWASLLSPAAYQALRERVDIEFPPTNPAVLAVDADVAVDVTFKHTPKVIVKIYEVNTLGYYLVHGRQLNTDLNLDGLVANSEQTHDGEASPFKRVTRRFQFPELKGRRGAWVIEFIGGGKSSRALLRKGAYSLVQRPGSAGDRLIILDEKRHVATNAVAWLDGRRLEPDPKTGAILVPFTATPGRKLVVLADATGGFASLAQFDHHAEAYRLDAQFHVEREQLIARQEATLAVRTTILVGDVPVAAQLLQEPVLSITTLTQDGIRTTSEVKSLKLSAGQVFTYALSVPDRLAELTVTLRGKVDLLSRGGEKQELSASRTWVLNGIDKTEATYDGHLSRFIEEFVFELLGKNGEPVADQQVVFEFRRQGFKRSETVPLRTDDRGRVALGKLEGIRRVQAQLQNGRKDVWELAAFARTWPEVIHAPAGEAIRVPWDDAITPGAVSLLELRGGEFVADRMAALKRVGAFLELTGLEPGDYSLVLRQNAVHAIHLRVTAGVAVGNWLLAANRSLEMWDLDPLQVESVTVNTNSVTIQLRNWNPLTRVHVATSRFLPGRGLFGGLGGFSRFGPSWMTPDRLPNLYSAGREIGDEYRYILERRYAQKFPGNQLARPGLLLNPWDKRSTDTSALGVSGAQVAMPSPGSLAGANMSMDMAQKHAPAGGEGGEDTNLDFLADASPVLFNLVPDAQGVVKVPPSALGDRQQIQVYAEDPLNAVWGTFALAERPIRFRDLRMARPLDPAKPFTETKEITVLVQGSTLTLGDILTGELETYETLGSVYSLYTTLSGDATLAKFAWILDWPILKETEKKAKYSEFACHELNLFLSRKDPKFFAEVIKPYLLNKQNPTFLDDYLLEADLKRYLEPWAYARLNVVERVLLARRLPGEAAPTARHLRELWELLPPDPEAEDRLFETALRGRALEPEAEAAGKPNSAPRRPGQQVRGEKRKAELNALSDAADSAVSLAPEEESLAYKSESRSLSRFRRDKSSVQPQRQGLAGIVPLVTNNAVDPTDVGRGLAKETLFTTFDFDGVTRDRAATLAHAYFRALGPTREWAENNYYRIPIERQDASLITINAFWRDFAAWDGRTPFLSIHFAEPHRNFAEMLLALAMLDLPFEAPAHAGKTENNTYTLTASGPVIVFLKQFKPATVSTGAGPGLLLSEGFFRQGDRYRIEGNEKYDKFVSEEFLNGVVYGAHLVVSNPGSSPLKLDLLTQVPEGALPVLGSRATRSRFVRLKPYTTYQAEYYFYFPAPPTNANATPFLHFPANASLSGKTAGTAKALAFRVVRQLSKMDTSSWDYISQQGSEPAVFAFLDQNNFGRLDLERVAWRSRTSVDFFHKLTAFLDHHHIWSEPNTRYAVVHNDPAVLREWLRHHDEFLGQCGDWLDTRLVTLDPVERRAYEHLEYSPLVNQRVHPVGAERRIANPVLLARYRQLLGILSYRPTLSAVDSLSVTYYLFLQDRVEEALTRFKSIPADAVPMRLQYDYLRCYAALYEEKLAEARGIAARYTDHPVDRWRAKFADVTAQLDEIEGRTAPRSSDPTDREKQQGALAAGEPMFEFKVENRSIALTWRNLNEVTVNYYLMDPEFLFSSSPFVTRDADRFGIIKPTVSVVQALPKGTDTLAITMPGRFAQANVLVEILGGGKRQAQTYHANTFKLALAENYGRLELRDQSSDKPVGKAYVKVYARLRDGTVRYMKDGYTDLRGRFDYASINGGLSLETAEATLAGKGLDYPTLRPAELARLEKLAILILSETHGAAVREVEPPRQ